MNTPLSSSKANGKKNRQDDGKTSKSFSSSSSKVVKNNGSAKKVTTSKRKNFSSNASSSTKKTNSNSKTKVVLNKGDSAIKAKTNNTPDAVGTKSAETEVDTKKDVEPIVVSKDVATSENISSVRVDDIKMEDVDETPSAAEKEGKISIE